MLQIRSLTAAFVLLLLSSTPLAAQIRLQLASGDLLDAEILSLDRQEGMKIKLEGGEAKTIAVSELISLSFPQPTVRYHDAQSGALRFDIAGGDLLYGEVLDGDFDQVRVESEAGRVDLPLDYVRSLRVLANSEGLRPELLTSAAQDRDLVLIRSGHGIDQVVGEVARFARNGVFFDWTGEEASLFAYRKDHVVAVRLAQTLHPEAAKGPFARVHFRDGSVLSGEISQVPGSAMTLQHAIGFTLDLDAARVAAITFYGSPFSHLSDLEPSSFVVTSYIEGGTKNGMKADESLKGGALTISDSWFPKGLSMHSKSEVSYKLKGRGKALSVSFGIDGRVAKERVKASIAFSLKLDGKLVYGPTIVRAGDPPQSISGLSLAGAEEITLIADFADNHHFNGWAVWGMPVVTWLPESR